MRNKIILSIFLIGLMQINLNAQTNVGGTLSSNTTWAIEGSPYTLTNTLGVPSGITLTVEPGVEIIGVIQESEFSDHKYDITILGNLILDGKADSNIVIKDTRIIFKNTNLSNSHISYSFFDYSCIQLDYSSPTLGLLEINQVILENSARIRAYGNNSSANINVYNSILNNSFIDNWGNSENIYINNCSSKNTRFFSGTNSKLIGININQCSIDSCIFVLHYDSNIDILKSNVFNTPFTYQGSDGEVSIDSSFLDNTQMNLYKSDVNISNSLILFNPDELREFPLGSCCNLSELGSDLLIRAKNLYFQNVSIIGTGNGRVTEIENSSQIKNTLFWNVNNSIEINNGISTINTSNFFNINDYCIYNTSNENIDGKNNWWGTSNASIISDVIYDMFDDINSGQVDYSNYLSLPGTEAPISLPQNIYKSSSENGVKVIWNSNLESDVAGYKIYYNPVDEFTYSNSIEVGSDTSYTIIGIDLTDTIVVTSYDNQADGTNDLIEGHESWYSEPAQQYFTSSLISGNSYCKGAEIEYQLDVIADFNNDNNFIVQLSDTTGNFDNPVNLITIDTSASVLINSSFPDTLIFEEQYKIRVKSTNPEFFSNSETVIFHQIPSSEFTLSTNKLCGIDTVLISYTGSGTSNAIYNWNFDNGSIFSGSDAGVFKIIWSNSGLKTVYLSVSENGCSSDTSINLTVNQQTQPISICMVSVDSSNYNVVVWEQPIDIPYDSIFIYKETSQSNVYEKIGSQSAINTSVYIDENSNSAQNSSRYKIAVLDTCGFETTQSEYHKTMHLTINSGIDGTWNLIWDGYEGFSYGTYNIYRGTSENNMLKIAEQASNTFTYSDLTPPAGSVYYQIEIVNPNSCNISNQKSTKSYYGSTRSNVVNSSQTTFINNIKLESIEIWPNPAYNKLYLKSQNNVNTFEVSIISLAGKIFIKKQIIESDTEIDISFLNKGMYIIRLNMEDKNINKKLIKL